MKITTILKATFCFTTQRRLWQVAWLVMWYLTTWVSVILMIQAIKCIYASLHNGCSQITATSQNVARLEAIGVFDSNKLSLKYWNAVSYKDEGVSPDMYFGAHETFRIWEKRTGNEAKTDWILPPRTCTRTSSQTWLVYKLSDNIF